MRLVFHGILREKYGVDFHMEVDSVAEAVEGFSRQQADWPRDLRIAIPGFDTPEKLKGHANEIHLMPALSGGGGKFGSILLGVALIASIFVLPAIGIGLTTAMVTSMAITGGMMILQGVVGLFMKAPKIEKNSDPAASKYLGINQNTTAVGTPITFAFGRIDLHPHWLSLQSDSTNLSHGSFPTTPA
jgi:predicted phage tail protein